MKTITLFIILIIPLLCLGQINIETSITLQTKFIDTNDCKPVVVFSEEEKEVLQSVLQKQLKSKHSAKYNAIYKKSSINLNSVREDELNINNIIYQLYNRNRITQDLKSLFNVKDSFKLKEIYSLLYKETGEPMYDDEGDEMYGNTINEYISFNKNINSLSNIENWKINSNSFTKETVSNTIDFHSIKNKEYLDFYISYSYLNLDNKKKTKILLKKDVIYDQILLKKYYNLFKNNKEILKNRDYYNLKQQKYNEEDILRDELTYLISRIYKLIKNKKVTINPIYKDSIKYIDISSKEINKLLQDFRVKESDKLLPSGISIPSKNRYIQNYSSNDIIGFQFHEDWYIDENSFNITKKVKGLVILIEDFDNKGVLIGYKKLPFYISFEN